jgi:acylglycerol lipase
MALAIGLGACAPRVASPGPPTGPPVVFADALIATDGARLPLRAWLPMPHHRAVIVALHGFNDYSNSIAAAAAYWASQGIAVYAYDQRGFGDAPNRGVWPGVEGLTGDLAAAVLAVRDRHPGIPVFVLGESMGGAVVLAAMAGANPPAADGAILVAPAILAHNDMPFYQRWALELSAYAIPSWRVTSRSLGIATTDNTEMLSAVMSDPKVIKAARIDTLWGLANLMDDAVRTAGGFDAPALILSGAHDEIVTDEPINALLARLPASGASTRTVIRYENGYHMLLRDLQAETVWRDVARWIDTRIEASKAATLQP